MGPPLERTLRAQAALSEHEWGNRCLYPYKGDRTRGAVVTVVRHESETNRSEAASDVIGPIPISVRPRGAR